ncbi:MAG: hypothetical protein ACJA0S_001426 [Rickettsiales bacterium]|jgi:hypothetical protein
MENAPPQEEEEEEEIFDRNYLRRLIDARRIRVPVPAAVAVQRLQHLLEREINPPRPNPNFIINRRHSRNPQDPNGLNRRNQNMRGVNRRGRVVNLQNSNPQEPRQGR